MSLKSRPLTLLSVFVLFSFVLQASFPFVAKAQTKRQLERETSNTVTEKRVALVIGNGAYTKAKPLPNPANDAADMAIALKALGFEVISGVNQSKRQIETLIRDFGTKLAASGGTGLFYYAGHGIQVGGENYIVPVEADIPEEDEVAYSAVPISLVLTKMSSAKNDLNIVILDACRNNPFARSWRGFRDGGNADGLAKISPPTGTLVLYATEPGKVASDGTGRNGLFTEALLKQIRQPNVEYDQLVKAVSADVWARSNKQQLPWKEGNALQNFYFRQTGETAVILPGNTSDPVIEAKTAAAQEREAWDLVKNSSDPGDLRLYLKEFPTGANAGNARIKLEELVWSAAKASSDKAKVEAYLAEFPSGANAAAARIRLRQIEAASVTPSNPTTVPTTTGAVTPGTVRKSPAGIELVWVPPGEFMMGSSDTEIDEALYECKKYNNDCKREWFAGESPKRKVTIRDGFWMGKYEVTQGEWQSVMGDNPSGFKDCGGRCPVETVSWDDIQVFLKRLNAKDSQFEYSLPTEAQWEYAARAGTTTAFAFGDSLNSSQANFNGGYPYASTKGTNIGKTVTVGSYRPNAWGLYDMHGNVYEWVQDIFNASYSGLPTDGSANLSVGDAKYRVLRGGSWSYSALNTRSANRSWSTPSLRYHYIGFRVAARPK